MSYPAKIKNRFLALGYYQIIGGIIGISFVGWYVFSLPQFYNLLLIIVVPAFILFLYSIYCGTLLVRLRQKGIKLSLMNQYLQLISFAIGGYAVQYASGVYLNIGLDFTETFNILFGAGVSSWQLNINTNDPSIHLNFNFIALLLIIVLIKLEQRIKDEINMNLFQEPEPPAELQ